MSGVSIVTWYRKFIQSAQGKQKEGEKKRA
jgi:hypothetical protein